ncbi:hypothetical protein ID866_6513 [Astraeus odoratus]|nr:hypothetical protein ID866_6513 [Astraeus odoratus]
MPRLLSVPRTTALFGSILVAICSGTNYIYAAYAPQLGIRLHISYTQLNLIGLAGYVGFYVSGPIWGRFIDRRGPGIPLLAAAMANLVGYAGTRHIYNDGTGTTTSISPVLFAALVTCGLLTGLGANAGLASSVNTMAKSFPESALLSETQRAREEEVELMTFPYSTAQ